MPNPVMESAVAHPEDGPIEGDHGHAEGDGFWHVLEGFATKTGFRLVFNWDTEEPITGVVRWGFEEDNLDRITLPFASGVDSAQIAITDIDRSDIGNTVYWRVQDQTTGMMSPVKSFSATNAWTSEAEDGIYEIDAVMQLDSKSLPDGLSSTEGLEFLADSMDVFAERIWDATDGYVRIGNVLITDTVLNNPAYLPSGFPLSCAPGMSESPVPMQHTLADFIVQTTVPFDSSTWGPNPMIDNPCTAFYVGRLGQLVIPWGDDLHMASVLAHEFGHYGFGFADLYPVLTSTADCVNNEFDISMMHNSGGWTGSQWRLSQVDRGPDFTPCNYGNQPASWPILVQRYDRIPLEGRFDDPEHPQYGQPDRSIGDPTVARGNPDGDALDIFIMDHIPGASSIRHYVESEGDEPDDPATRITSPADGASVPPAPVDVQGISDRRGLSDENAPTTTLDADPDRGAAPLDVTFEMSASAQGERALASWELDAGDGSEPYGEPGGPPTTLDHTYETDGTFEAILTVTDTEGATGQAGRDIIVEDPIEGLMRIGTDPAGDLETGPCGSDAVNCDRTWVDPASDGLDMSAAYVEERGADLRFFVQSENIDDLFNDPQGDPGPGDPAHILSYSLTVHFETSPATLYQATIQRDTGSNELSGVLGQSFCAPAGGCLTSLSPGFLAAHDPETNLAWVDIPKSEFPEGNVIGLINELQASSSFSQEGAQVQLVTNMDTELQTVDNNTFTYDETELNLGFGADPLQVRDPDTEIPGDPEIVDATGDVTAAGLPVDHMDIEAGWFDNDENYLYVGLKIGDIPADPTTTSQVAYNVNFHPDWVSNPQTAFGVPGDQTFTGLRVQAVLSLVGLDESVTTNLEHHAELQFLSTSGPQSFFGKVTDLQLVDVDPETDIIWWAVPRQALADPGPDDTLSALSATSVPAVRGVVTFGTDLGDTADANPPGRDYPWSDTQSPLESVPGGPYPGMVDSSIPLTGTGQGGTEPYTCAWDGPAQASFTNTSACSTDVVFNETGTFKVGLNVTDADNTTALANTTVSVSEISGERMEIYLDGENLAASTAINTEEQARAEWSVLVDLDGLEGEHTITARWFDADDELLDEDTITVSVSPDGGPLVTIDEPEENDSVGGSVSVAGTAGHGQPEGQAGFGENGLFQEESSTTREGTLDAACPGCHPDRTGVYPGALESSSAWWTGPDSPANGVDGVWLNVAGFAGSNYRLDAEFGSPMDIYFWADWVDLDDLGRDVGGNFPKEGSVPGGANWAFVYMRGPDVPPDPDHGYLDTAILDLFPPISAPQNLETLGLPGSVELDWEAPQWDGGSDLSEYRVWRDGAIHATVPTEDTEFTDDDVSAGESYMYEVSAVNEAGNEGPRAGPVSGAPTNTDLTPPSAVDNLVVEDTTSTTATVSWDAATDDGTGVTHYEVERDGTLVGEPTTTAFTDTGLAPETTYTYAVRAVDGAGNKGPVSDVDATTQASSGEGERVVVEVNGDPIDEVPVNADGGVVDWDTLWDTTGFPDGTHTIRATYHDGQGGSASTTVQVEVDNEPSDAFVTIDEPEDGAEAQPPVNFEGRFSTTGEEPTQAVEGADLGDFLDDQLADWVTDPFVRNALRGTDMKNLTADLENEDGYLAVYPDLDEEGVYVVYWEADIPDDVPETSSEGHEVRHVNHTQLRTLEETAFQEADALSVAETAERLDGHDGPNAPGVLQGTGPGGAIQMRKANANGALATSICTASYLFEDPETGTYYLATAGHCLLDATEDANGNRIHVDSELSPQARARSVDLCFANCVNNFAGLGDYVRLVPNETYHPVAWAEARGIGDDFGLIEIPLELNDILRPWLWFWGGPTGIDRPSLGDPVAHYGFGIGLGQAFPTQGRLGVTLSASHSGGLNAVGWINGGDSGSAFGTAFPRTDRMVVGDGAAGALTHAVVEVGAPLMWGTDLQRGLDDAEGPLGFRPGLVKEDAQIRTFDEPPDPEETLEATITSPEEGATINAGETPELTVRGTGEFPASGAGGTETRTFWTHRSDCGGEDVLWMDETQGAEPDGGDGCGDLAGLIGPVWEALIGEIDSVHPADPRPDETILIDTERDLEATIFLSGYSGFAENPQPVPVVLDATVRLSYDGIIVGSARIDEEVILQGQTPITFAFSSQVDAIPKDAQLQLAFIVHHAAGPVFMHHGGDTGSHVELPLAIPPDNRVEVSVDDPEFNEANRLSVTGLESWDAPWDITGLQGEKTLYARALQNDDPQDPPDSVTVNIESDEAEGPHADFTFEVSDKTVDFTDASTPGDAAIDDWAWDFGDDTTSTSQNPVHTYQETGTYTVILTVTDENGLDDTTEATVTLSEWSVQLRLSDPNGDEVFGWTPVAGGVSGDADFWNHEWDPAPGVAAGTYLVEARIMEGDVIRDTTSSNFIVPPESEITIDSPQAGETVAPDFTASGQTQGAGGPGEPASGSFVLPDGSVDSGHFALNAMDDPAFDAIDDALSAQAGYSGLGPALDGTRTLHALFDGGMPDDLPTHLLPDGWTLEGLELEWERARLDDVVKVDLSNQTDREGPPLPGQAAGIGPGSRLHISSWACTANFVWEDQNGNLYLGSAGHCFLPESATATHGPGANFNPSNMRVDVCVANCQFGGQSGFVLTGDFVRLGEVVYARQAGAGTDPESDFGLVRIPDELRDLVRPEMPVWDGPDTESDIAPGAVTMHYGNAAGWGEVWPTMARAGVAVPSVFGTNTWFSAHPSFQGDSGSGVSHALPQGDDAVIRGEDAGGVLTHGIVGNPFFAIGPTISRAQTLALQAELDITLVTQGTDVSLPDPEPPGKPRNLVASPADGEVGLDWDEPMSDGGAPIQDYTVKWGTESGGPYLDSKTVTTTATTLTGLTNDQTYHFIVNATNEAGDGEASDEVSATPQTATQPPSAPRNLQSAPGDESAELFWDPPADDGGASVDHYTVKWGTDSGGPYPDSEDVTGTSTVVTGLANDQTYFFVVSATNEAGEGPDTEESSATPESGPTEPGFTVQVRLSTEDSTLVDWTEVDAYDGTSWSHAFSGIPEGATTLDARLMKDGEDTAQDMVEFTVEIANRAPELSAIGDRNVDENELLEFNVNANDPDDDPITLSAHALPDGATFTDHGDNTGTFSWTPNHDQAGDYDVTFTASDTELTDSETIAIKISDVNRPPVLDPVGDREVDEDELLEFTVSSSDPDGDPLSLDAGPLPDGAGFTDHGDGTGTFSWTPDFDQTGQHDVDFTTSDAGLTDEETITITVNDVNRPPALDLIDDQQVDEEQLLEFTVSASDPDGDPITLSADALPDGATFTDHDDGTGTFSWTPQHSQEGDHDVDFTADDGDLADTQTITISVNRVNAAPELETLVDQEVDEEELLEFIVSATDPNEDPLSLTGDPLPSGATFTDHGDGSGTFSWTPQHSQEGDYDVEFTADDGDLADTQTITISVNRVNAAPQLDTIGDQSIDEGQNLEFTVGATDPNEDPLSLTGDPLPSGATFTDHGDGTGTFSWTPGFEDAGDHSVEFTADDGELSDAETIQISVIDVNRAPELDPLADQEVDEDTLLEFLVSASDPDGDAITLDAQSRPAGATFTDHGDGTGTFSWQPDFGQQGDHNIPFTANDGDLTDTETIKVTVNRVNLPPELDAIEDQSVVELEQLAFGVSATDPNDDPLTLTVEPLPEGAVLTDHGDGTATFDWTPQMGQSGVYEVTVTAADDELHADQTLVITVDPFFPLVPVLGIDPQVTGPGVPITLEATGSHQEQAAIVRLTVDPGDGTTPYEATTPADAVFLHAYEEVGEYTVHLEIENEFGDTNETTKRVDVTSVHNEDQDTWHLSLQDGVDRAQDGETVLAHPADYLENVVVTTHGVTIRSVEPNEAILRPETGFALDVASENVTLEDFRIEAPEDGGAIRADAEAGGTLTIRGHTFVGPGAHLDALAVDATAATPDVDLVAEDNIVEAHKNGFLIDGVAFAQILRNAFTGSANGVHLLAGAGASMVTDNEVSGANGNAFEIAGTGHTLERNTVMMGTGTGIVIAGDQHEVVDNKVQASGTGIRLAPGAADDSRIDDNELRDNDVGILVETGASGTPTFRLNRIYGNDVGLTAQEDTSVDAVHNWWGHVGGPLFGDGVEGTTNYTPWCLQPGCPTGGDDGLLP